MRQLELDVDEILVFDIFFAGIVSMAHCHPANGRSNGFAEAPPKKSIEDCADVALEMIEVRRRVLAPTVTNVYNGVISG